ncbi:ABC transporter substrate-binding protein [Streptomyces sp. NPDC048282]|uniref:ABC transporter substrate-binding protein n=1 Tax=Streptomyces sp. NPDC048282 TaxID=3365528 RepID=UPI0037241014
MSHAMTTRRRHGRPIRHGAGATAATAGLLLVAACAPGGVSSDTTKTTAVSTTIPSDKKITLTLATSENAGLTKGLIAAFEKAHPNITITMKYTGYDDYNHSLGLSLASDSSPDIVLLNMVGTTVKNKLLLNLDPYAKAYGWDKVYPSSQLSQWQVGSDGVSLGTGHLWAAPAGFSMVGVFYNKELAAKLGITSPPTTLAEFQADLDKAEAAGKTGLQMPNLDGHSAFVVQSIAQSVDGAEATRKWFEGRTGSTFSTPGNLQGAQSLLKWSKAGELSKGANGTDLSGAVAAFAKGDGLFLVDGNWDAATIDKALPGKVGFVAYPKASSGGKYAAVGGSIAYGISARSKNADAAAAFLDFWHSKAAAQVQLDHYFMPADSSSSAGSDAKSVLGDMSKAWAQVNQDNGLVGFYANATSSMNDTLTSSSQSLIAGRVTPQEYVDAVQKDWSKAHTK